MATTDHVQRDFSAGEISARMLMRADTDVYNRAALEMVNVMPTPQGNAVRMPGTRFLQEILDKDGNPNPVTRIVPYFSPANERSLLVLTPLNLKKVDGIGVLASPSSASISRAGETVNYRRQIVENGEFLRGAKDWSLSPAQYPAAGESNGSVLGAWANGSNGGLLTLACRLYKRGSTDYDYAQAKTTVQVPAVGSDTITVAYRAYLESNIPIEGGYDLTLTVRDGTTKLWEESLEGIVGTIWEDSVTVDTPTDGFTGPLEIEIYLRAKEKPPEKNSTPLVRVEYFHVYANDTTTVSEIDEDSVYTAAELPDVHFVQSPYLATTPYANREMVFTHPSFPPQRLLFDNTDGDYKMLDIPFVNEPDVWGGAGYYPKTCTSYMGRLVLGGSYTASDLGSPVQSATETVWGTKVGDWITFSDDNNVNPDDSIEFTAIYRSPIQWLYGQKSLLVGAQEMEYIVSADGIFSPGDLGVALHSTHGSRSVQPAGLGEGVAFAAENGRKLRIANYADENASWVAKDYTLLNPDITEAGIIRMVRLRNPLQSVVVLLDDGTLAVLFSEGGVEGWSRIEMAGATVADICVMPDDSGVDVLYMTVKRTVGGVERLYLEAISDWVEGTRWSYLGAANVYNPNSHILGGLAHLEGEVVQVAADGQYLGTFRVEGGQVEVVDQIGQPIVMQLASAGLVHPMRFRSLPPPKRNPGDNSRLYKYSIRILSSMMPVINGERPPERKPNRSMHLSQGVELIADVQVSKMGWDNLQTILIEETIPLPVRILGIHAHLKANSL